jgi:hypothetical protein
MKLNPHLFICPDCNKWAVVEWSIDIPTRDIIIHKKRDCCGKVFDEERHSIRACE